ncbi:hypothetical protein V1503_19095 [Bacillus sp. SCS-151]|uniref:hypothetical protein n=1 Tax=Nanhaiella sioensis TaxID=3115293 RepID=UPI00397BF37E
MIKNKIFNLMMILFLLLPYSSVAMADQNTDLEELGDTEVYIEAYDKDGKIAEGTEVSIFSLSEDGSERVFNDFIGKNGKLKFNSSISSSKLEDAPGNVADAVYEVYFSSPDNELKREVFSVSHIKDKELAKQEKALDKLNKDRKKVISTKFSGDKKIKENNSASMKSVEGISTLASLSCEPLVAEYKKCNYTFENSTEDTKVGEVNIGTDMNVSFSMTSAAKVNIYGGYSIDNDPWSQGGSVSLTSDVSTGIDYSIDGTCKYIGSTLYCDLTYDLYARYKYLYESYDLYFANDFQYTRRDVTPVTFVGSTTTENWASNGRNGKNWQDVKNSQYGASFSVSDVKSTTKSYSSETTYSGGFGVSTPIGTFSGKVTTSYVDKHSIKYQANSGHIYWVYDYDWTENNWYVTKEK